MPAPAGGGRDVVIVPYCTDANELGYQISSLVRVGEPQAGVVAAPRLVDRDRIRHDRHPSTLNQSSRDTRVIRYERETGRPALDGWVRHRGIGVRTRRGLHE